ncbi:unnamed protein product [Clonostachys byssicola]|uniref:Uncharacterized protein n=1 Tax=Clonostachys byssicola TaxID=160290 RepID=A0A9N9UZY0_9HYPO|nr:unnamed protein product [Clonostachys byssicola]
MEKLFAPPLNYYEQEIALGTAQGTQLYNPKAIYGREERFEIRRMANSMDFCREKYIEGESGARRLRVLARRNIRKRWKKMGVWNSAWGIPCREPPEPNDSTFYWRWEWQHGEFAAEATSLSSPAAKTHPIASALLSRQGLRFGECQYRPPLSHPTEQTSPSEAMSFIASRPCPRFLAKEPDAMPPKALTETGDPSYTKRSRLSEKISAVEPSSSMNKPRTKTDTPSTKPRGRPPKTTTLPQSPSSIPDGTAPSKKAQVKRRGRSPKATRLTRSPPNIPEPVPLPTKTQAKPKGRPPKAASQAQPRPGAHKTATKTETSAIKRSGHPPNTAGWTQRPSGISKPIARSKKSQAKSKEGPLPALLMEDKQPPGKTADRKTARAIDKPGDVVQTKNTPPEKENRPSLKPTVGAAPPKKRKRDQHKKSDTQGPLDTIVVQLNDSIEALGRDQTAPLVGSRRSERIKDREKKKQRTG